MVILLISSGPGDDKICVPNSFYRSDSNNFWFFGKYNRILISKKWFQKFSSRFTSFPSPQQKYRMSKINFQSLKLFVVLKNNTTTQISFPIVVTFVQKLYCTFGLHLSLWLSSIDRLDWKKNLQIGPGFWSNQMWFFKIMLCRRFRAGRWSKYIGEKNVFASQRINAQ